MPRTNRTGKKRSKSKNDYEYIGKFVWLFGTIENYVNEIFLELFDLERVAFMFIGLIDTRKTLKLIEIGFADKGDHTHKKLDGSKNLVDRRHF
jgi:hypothetical protein